ncbi:TPA: hypothetical protein NJY08_005225, partial [Salmonella enterica subsp. enterica serovar Typhi str. AG3]|nr:hypothetical protein [Salmonella enterica subsp. enterica serovar Typhi str. AG3]
MNIQYIILIALIAITLYLVYEYQKYKRLKTDREETFGGKQSTQSAFKIFNKYAQSAYNIILRTPIVNKLLLRIRKKIETLSVYDEYTLRREVVKILGFIFSIFTIACLIIIAFRPNWLIVFWIMVGILLLSGILIDFFVNRVETKLLIQLKNFLNRVTFSYQQTKMIDEALFDAIQYAGVEMKIHAEKIYNIINSLEPERELSEYEEVAPTRYLRVFAGLSLLIKERGDKFSEKGSSFVNGLTAINKELNDEILYRSRLTHALRSLSTISLIPIFLAMPVKNWSIENFPTTEAFYSSRIGFLSEIAVYGASVICYLVIRKMREVNEESLLELKVTRKKWESWLLRKVPLLDTLCEAFTPKKHTKQYRERMQLIKDANENITVKELTLQRIVTSILVFLILISAFSFAHYRESLSVLNQTASTSLFSSAASEKEKEQFLKQTEYDK